MGEYPRLPRWALCNHEGSFQMEAGGSEAERFEDAMLLALNMEEDATGQGMQVTTRSWKRQEKQFFLEQSTADPFWTAVLQNCKMIKLCCFKPLNVC